jgi:hypothetical protein
VLNLDGLARSEDNEGTDGDGGLRDIFKLDSSEGRLSARSVSDGECISRAVGEGTAGVIEDLQGLVSGVSDGSSNFQFINTIDCSRAYEQMRIKTLRRLQ